MYFAQMLKELCIFACIDVAGINVLLMWFVMTQVVCDDSSVDTNTTY